MTRRAKHIFGLQLRRASDLIGEQGREAFWRSGIELDAKLISLVFALFEVGPQSSSELVEFTGLSRQLVESRLKALEAEGYVKSAVSKEDARKRIFTLSHHRRAEISAAVEMMCDFEEIYHALWREIGVDLEDAILKLERALHARPLLSRLCQQFPDYQKNLKVRANDDYQ